ncbi:MAG: flavodoxin family protein [Chloroflexota bacterium]
MIDREARSDKEPRILILYWSATGNTEKVARAVERGVRQAGFAPEVVKTAEATALDLYDYDLVFLGVPSYYFLPPEPALRYIKDRMNFHRRRGDIKPRAPKLPGKRAVTFVTYAGPHTGLDEATPVGKYLGQFFAHIGFEVLDEWYVIGEYHGNEENSTKGCLGDIRGRPNAKDLALVEQKTVAVLGRAGLGEA